MTKNVFRDVVKTLIVSIVFSAAAFGLLFLAGLLLHERDTAQGLEMAKNGLLLVGALGLFVVAGMLLVKGKSPKVYGKDSGWRKQFSVLDPGAVIFIFSVVVLLTAFLADHLRLL